MIIKTIAKVLLIALIHPSSIETLFQADKLEFYPVSMTLGMAFLQALTLYFVISMHAGLPRLTVLWKTALIFYGVTFFQSGVEAVVFLNVMQDTMDASQIYGMIQFGLLSTVVTVPAATFIFWEKRSTGITFSLPVSTSIKRITFLSFIYLVVYIFFGALVFKPLAGKHFDTFYGDLQPSAWMLPLQALRGALWAFLAWWLMSILSGSRSKVIWAITAMTAIPITSLLLPVNEHLPEPIKIAHFIEVSSSMLLFGGVTGIYLTRPVKGKSIQGQSK